ncbi:MAG: hypothetical protein OXG25_03940 [Gammaproteobacteria bacterium]|nr:hypothetical protein [Gammaproteobacteria bacterium]
MDKRRNHSMGYDCGLFDTAAHVFKAKSMAFKEKGNQRAQEAREWHFKTE